MYMLTNFHQNFSGNDDKTNDSDGDSDGEDLPLSSAISSKDGKEKECAPLSPIPSASSLTSSNSALNDEPPPLSPQQLPTSVSTKKERISKKLCKELNACKVGRANIIPGLLLIIRTNTC